MDPLDSKLNFWSTLVMGKFNAHNMNHVRIGCNVIYWSEIKKMSKKHTYIHNNWSLQSISQDYWPSFSHDLCVLILYISGGTYCLKTTPNDRFFEKLFMAVFNLLSEFLPEICWEEIAEEILFVFCFDVWPGACTLAFRLISQHTTY